MGIEPTHQAKLDGGTERFVFLEVRVLELVEFESRREPALLWYLE